MISMIRSSWFIGLGAALLIACGVETSSTNAPPSAPAASEVSSELASPEAAGPDGAQTDAVCTPGQFRLCCSFPQGCGCRGDQTCDASGNWGPCEGSTPRGSQCP
jgi:hypothetical protein